MSISCQAKIAIFLLQCQWRNLALLGWATRHNIFNQKLGLLRNSYFNRIIFPLLKLVTTTVAILIGLAV